MSQHQDFQSFMKARKHAASAYVSGNAAPLARVVAHASPATLMGPGGDAVQGADAVWSRYEHDAQLFEPGSTTEFEILDMAAGDTVAYWTGYQKAQAPMRGQAQTIPMTLRVTEVFRLEGDAWKLVHRHADPLAEPGAKNLAGRTPSPQREREVDQGRGRGERRAPFFPLKPP